MRGRRTEWRPSWIRPVVATPGRSIHLPQPLGADQRRSPCPARNQYLAFDRATGPPLETATSRTAGPT